MEYQYSDIEAHIRRANELRSEALGEFIVTRWHALVTWLSSHAKRHLHKNIVATGSTAAATY